jgi:hypothetical protein
MQFSVNVTRNRNYTSPKFIQIGYYEFASVFFSNEIYLAISTVILCFLSKNYFSCIGLSTLRGLHFQKGENWKTMAFQVFLKRRIESIKNQKLLTGLKTRDFANQ